MQPAYRELLKFMRTEYLPGTRTTLAAYDLPDGQATTIGPRSGNSPRSIRIRPPSTRSAKSEVERLHKQMLAVMKETGFAGDFAAFLVFLRTDPQFQAKTPQELLMRAAWIAKRFDGKASQYFGLLPRARFAITAGARMISRRSTRRAAAARGSTWSTPMTCRAARLYNLTALTLHESAPGHAFQMPLALEHKQQPEFRQHTYLSAYGEGWALYCEQLGLEMGMYETPYDRFGMLNYQIWRAARLVVDTGIHAQGWSRERALAYLREYTALPEHEIETEVDRYIAWPAQALSYYLGEDAILKARSKAETGPGRALQSARVPRHRARTRIGADPGAGGAHRSFHCGRRQRPLSRIWNRFLVKRIGSAV